MKPFHISLPATSANLGPGFDTLALALDLHLEVTAELAESYAIQAVGRNADQCMNLRHNLIVSVYEETLRAAAIQPHPLALKMVNGIPLGMGCGSSAAARLTGITLANYFGKLAWDEDRILAEACRLEGHADNAAACWFGGFTVAGNYAGSVKAVSASPPADWTAVLVLGEHALSTSKARSMMPTTYECEDAFMNVQNGALLTAAFLSGREDLLRFAMQDRLHQPYRSDACPLLPLLLPLVGEAGIAGVALSGAGPAVLALVCYPDLVPGAVARIQREINVPAEILSVQLQPVFGYRPHSQSVK